MNLDHITADNLAKLSDQEAGQLLEALEAQHLQRCRDDIVEYATYIEVPGTPSPTSPNDRIRLLQKKQAMRRAEKGGWEEPEDLAFEEPDVAEDAYYPKQLEVFPHHRLILNALQALMEEEPVVGPLANGHEGIAPEGVMLFMPPGSAKSSFGSVVAPTYVMGRWPGTDVIGVSYAADLAKRFGRRARHICRSERFKEVFDCALTGDNQAVDQWSLSNGSTYRAVGVFGGVTGNRSDLLCADDLVAGREEAESEIIRDKTNAAVKDDLFTRLKPFGKVLMTLTRWNEDDPAGHILGEEWDGQSGLWKGTDGRWWLVLCVPLLADRDDDPLGREMGERLWPEWFTERFVELAKQAGDRAWQSLYQQKPAATEGVILLKRYWRCWPHGRPEPDEAQEEDPTQTETPKNWTQSFLVYDTAFEDGQDNDYSAMSAWAAFGRTPKADKRLGRGGDEEQQNLILVGGWRGKVQAVDLFKIVEQHVRFFMPDHIIVEKKASGLQLLQELRRRRPRYTDMGQTHYVSIHDWLPPFPPGANGKTPRLNAASVLLAEGSIWYMPGPTTAAIIKESAAAPNGKHDDWADTVTNALIWSRSVNLLEVSEDILHKDEEETVEREEREFEDSGRTLYGSSRRGAASNAARSLYGRISRGVAGGG